MSCNKKIGERATTEITQTEDSTGVPKLKSDAKRCGNVAGGIYDKTKSRRRYLVTGSARLKIPRFYLVHLGVKYYEHATLPITVVPFERFAAKLELP